MVERYRVYRRMARTLEHRAFIAVCTAVMMVSGVACAVAALFIQTPQIYLVNGISRVKEVFLSWL